MKNKTKIREKINKVNQMHIYGILNAIFLGNMEVKNADEEH